MIENLTNIRQDIGRQECDLLSILGQGANAIQHGHPFFWIQSGSRFIKNQQLRIMDNRLCEFQLLPHPGRVGLNIPIPFLAHATKIEDLM